MTPDISKNKEEIAVKVGTRLLEYITEVLKTRDQFTIALSGGSTPKALYDYMASPAFSQQVDWNKIHFFWGDERHVPFEDDRNNARMAFDLLLDQVPVKKNQVHIMRTDLDADESAGLYETLLRGYFDEKGPSFDVVLLGLGDDAHTLSLFPGLPVLNEKTKWVTSFYLERQQMHRVTLTAQVVNLARHVIFMVAGADKATPVYQVLYGEHRPELYPAQMIQPYHGTVEWFIDEGAAREFLR